MSVLVPQMFIFVIVIKLFFSISPITPVIGLNRDLSVHLPSSQIMAKVCAADQSVYRQFLSILTPFSTLCLSQCRLAYILIHHLNID